MQPFSPFYLGNFHTAAAAAAAAADYSREKVQEWLGCKPEKRWSHCSSQRTPAAAVAETSTDLDNYCCQSNCHCFVQPGKLALDWAADYIAKIKMFD